MNKSVIRIRMDLIKYDLVGEFSEFGGFWRSFGGVLNCEIVVGNKVVVAGNCSE